jgi:hypothetical protein
MIYFTMPTQTAILVPAWSRRTSARALVIPPGLRRFRTRPTAEVLR